MSGPIPGHGYRETVIVSPFCKCGWRGRTTASQANAREQYERHKADHRRRMGISERAGRRRLEVVS